MELLKPTWYFEFPFDYEIKLYNLLSYLRRVEDSFIKKCLSPHLLHLEKMEYELINFKNSYDEMIKDFNKKNYKYFKNDPIDGLDDNNLPEIYEIVDISIPQIQSKIHMGYKIFKTTPQLLF
jgi:hypothetical protein